MVCDANLCEYGQCLFLALFSILLNKYDMSTLPAEQWNLKRIILCTGSRSSGLRYAPKSWDQGWVYSYTFARLTRIVYDKLSWSRIWKWWSWLWKYLPVSRSHYVLSIISLYLEIELRTSLCPEWATLFFPFPCRVCSFQARCQLGIICLTHYSSHTSFLKHRVFLFPSQVYINIVHARRVAWSYFVSKHGRGAQGEIWNQYVDAFSCSIFEAYERKRTARSAC